jgi:hypothetical protein
MQLRTEVEIDAPPEHVWATLVDFAAYGEWNPFLVSVTGEAAAGATLQVTASPPGGREMTFRAQVLVAEPSRELRWRGRLWADWLFTGEHFFQLRAAGGRTRVVHGEDFGGLLVKPLGGLLTRTARGFVYMNQALKKRVEGTP